MKLSQVGKYNVKKLQSYKQRSLYLLVPVTLLLIIGVTLTSQTKNIQSAIEQSVFGTVEKQGTLLSIQKQVAETSTQGGPGGFGGGQSSTQNSFTSSDTDKVTATAGVQTAQIVSTLPISTMSTSTLISGKTIDFTGLTGLDSNLAGLYTDQDFSYTSGGVIPVILNANQFKETYQDWGGQTSITTTFTRGSRRSGTSTAPAERPGPEKSRAVTFDKTSLIGSTFTGNIGGLTDLPTFSTTFTSGGLTFTQLNADQITAQETARDTALSPYWNYSALKAPVQYTFKIVGIIDDAGIASSSTYIPETAAETIMHDVINKQLTARTATAIPTTDLNQTFTGITYDGLELQSGQGLNFAGRGPRGISQSGTATATTTATTSYQIPGLVVQTDRTTASSDNPFDRGTVSGIYTDPNVYTTATRSGTTMLIKINNVYDRDAVVTALNADGYAYQDTSKLGVVSTLKSHLDTATTAFIIAFIILTALIMASSLTRFVSDSKREIGIFRALGATKNQIRTLFMGQAILYGLVAGIAGIGLGLLTTEAIAKPIHTWFSNFVDSSLRATYPTITTASSSVFNGLNWTGIGLLLIILIVVTIGTALFTATSAARVSPAEAIKRD